ncbi:hypothetical protein KR018_007321 [Drosophila ironensis]|nr:hypothetical protein KR018_007321 [Drosophila ironensis]
MSYNQILLVSAVLLGVGLNSFRVLAQTTINCQRPPQLVDPALCCKDGGRDQVTEQCTQKILGAPTAQKLTRPPSLETAACLAECTLTTSNYIQQPQQVMVDTIRSDLTAKFSNDTDFVNAMTTAFQKCELQSQRRLAVIMQQMQRQQQERPQAQQQQQQSCSPFSAILLGCTYMEYFKNCPKDRWTPSAECALAKAYVTQCGLGA